MKKDSEATCSVGWTEPSELRFSVGQIIESFSDELMLETTCFHCSTSEDLSRKEFKNVVEIWFVIVYTYRGNPKSNQEEWVESFYDNQHQKLEAKAKFYNDNELVLKDLRFARFLFALAAAWYLKMGTAATFDIQTLLDLAIRCKYLFVPKSRREDDNKEKMEKYQRDICDERGIINVLLRETKPFCDCLAAKKIEAKGMEKLEQCYGCKVMFPKRIMKKCNGCNMVVYHSTECIEKYWHLHKESCQSNQRQKQKSTIRLGWIEPSVLRFSVGQTVAFSYHKGWQLGTIVQLNYTESRWDHYVPYQIHFDDCEDEQTTSRLIFAPRDSDTCIRATIPTESEILEDLMTEFQLTYFLNTSND